MALDHDVPWAVHSTLAATYANGPGRRFAVWVQGCSLACAGCFNPETHRPAAPERTALGVLEMVREAAPIDGVTVTGGEPLEQAGALQRFLRALRSDPELSSLGVVVLTGYTRAEIERSEEKRSAIRLADSVVAGRFNSTLHLGAGLRGSSNKVYWHLTSRYDDAAFESTPEVEVHISSSGDITITGMEPITLTGQR